MSLERFPNKVFRTLAMPESTEEQRKAPCWHSAANSSYSISYTTNSREPDKSACDIIYAHITYAHKYTHSNQARNTVQIQILVKAI